MTEDPDWAELERLVSTRRFNGSCMRTNITDAPRYKHKNGSTYLKERILSDVVRDGPIFDQCVKMLGWTPDQVTLNKNIVTKPHVDRNKGQSAIAFVGQFEGGALLVQEGDNTRARTRSGECVTVCTTGSYCNTQTVKKDRRVCTAGTRLVCICAMCKTASYFMQKIC